MKESDYYSLWDRIIDFVLILSGFFIAVFLYTGLPYVIVQ